MIRGSQILRGRISAGATARLDRRFADREFAERNLESWLHQVAGKIRWAISRRIPVGFEDETGFHLGVQPAGADNRMAWERAGILVDEEYF
jgi:hypothetical protein